MESYDLEVDPLFNKAEWKCAMRDSGEQCVMTTGGPPMLKWHADSLDSRLMVRFDAINAIYIFTIIMYNSVV